MYTALLPLFFSSVLPRKGTAVNKELNKKITFFSFQRMNPAWDKN